MASGFKHNGHTVVLTTSKQMAEPEIWHVAMFIDGARIPFCLPYPAKHHPTEEDALKYGETAAKYVIDHPAKGNLDELDALL